MLLCFVELWSIGTQREREKTTISKHSWFRSTPTSPPGDLEEDLSTQLKFHSWLHSTQCQYEKVGGKPIAAKFCGELDSTGDVRGEAGESTRTKWREVELFRWSDHSIHSKVDCGFNLVFKTFPNCFNRYHFAIQDGTIWAARTKGCLCGFEQNKKKIN